jgi:hypothetical protein
MTAAGRSPTGLKGRQPKFSAAFYEAQPCGSRSPGGTPPEPGSPLKRQRKAGISAGDGSVIAFPYIPRVAELPPGWRHFSPAQKIEHLIGMDRCYEILSWPLDELDPVRRSMRMQVLRVILPIGIKALVDGKLGRDAARERKLRRGPR